MDESDEGDTDCFLTDFPCCKINHKYRNGIACVAVRGTGCAVLQ